MSSFSSSSASSEASSEVDVAVASSSFAFDFKKPPKVLFFSTCSSLPSASASSSSSFLPMTASFIISGCVSPATSSEGSRDEDAPFFFFAEVAGSVADEAVWFFPPGKMKLPSASIGNKSLSSGSTGFKFPLGKSTNKYDCKCCAIFPRDKSSLTTGYTW